MQPNQIVVATTEMILANRGEDNITKVIHEICNKTPHFGIAIQVSPLMKRECGVGILISLPDNISCIYKVKHYRLFPFLPFTCIVINPKKNSEILPGKM